MVPKPVYIIYIGGKRTLHHFYKTTIMTDFNFATATPAELAAIGFTLTVKKSQAKTRRTRKSVFGVRPSMNNARRNPPVKVTFAIEDGGTIQN